MIRLIVPLSLLACSAVQATEFSTLQVDKSSLAFVSKQMGVPMKGAFRKFTAAVAIDPARPEAGRARIEIDLNGIDSGSEEADDELKGKSWFNVREFPKAVFVSSGVKTLGGGRFETTGKLSIKGRTLDSRAPFTLKQEKGVLILDGTFPIKRLDYGIGSGAWSDTTTISDEVLVKFHFVLK